jgi:poly(3-hydroxybutyrate) depolymerase
MASLEATTSSRSRGTSTPTSRPSHLRTRPATIDDSLKLTETTTAVPAVDGRHAYSHTTVAGLGGGSVVESYRVDGLGHAWPGPAGDGLFTDRAGPDASAIAWDFARRHPRGSGG